MRSALAVSSELKTRLLYLFRSYVEQSNVMYFIFLSILVECRTPAPCKGCLSDYRMMKCTLQYIHIERGSNVILCKIPQGSYLTMVFHSWLL